MKLISIKGSETPIQESATKLPPELKAKWLEALRSGKYKQGRDTLCDGTGYCCLGVLSDIQGRLTKDKDNDYYYDGNNCVELGHDNPVNFVNYYAAIQQLGTNYSLASLNDRGATFEEIANIIEYAL